MPCPTSAVGALLLCASPAAQDPVPPTVPEASAWTRTSTTADVRAFVDSLSALPHAGRLRVSVAGASHEGRELLTVTAGDPPPAADRAALAGERLRVLVLANIHGGEVEGKEAVQILLRELAGGAHPDVLERAVVVFLPVYNPDGNDRIDVANRVSQNGPDRGVGERANAQGLDLNRDFVKAESPECRALLTLLNAWDPHLLLDLHATNGSPHGYHLTYSPSLSTSVDAALDRFARETFLPAVRGAALEDGGWRVFDYGNFSRGNDPSWSTYDHRPRFGTNYVGLRNRLAVLAEAYAYLPFRTRVEATRAFVLECLHAAAARADEIAALCAAADARAAAVGEVRFGWDSALADGYRTDVLVGSIREEEVRDGEGTVLGRRRVAGPEHTAHPTLVRDRFVARRSAPLPAGWAIPDPGEAVTAALRHHGLVVERLVAPTDADVEAFVPTEVRRSTREFEGHHEIRLTGAWHAERRALPAGTLVVPAAQPRSRLAAQLLEPESEDSLSTWNFFEDGTRAAAEGTAGSYPVLRLVAPLAAEVEPVPFFGS